MNLAAIKDAQAQFDRLLVLHEARATEEEIARQASRTVNALVLAQHLLNGHHEIEVDLAKVAPTLPELLAEPDPPKAWAIGELLEEACGMLLYGPSYVGKSLVAWYAALCRARGFGAVLDSPVETPPGNVVVFYGESSRRQVKNAYRAFLGENPAPDTLRLVDAHAVTPFPNLAMPQGRAWYETVVRETRAILAVFDTSTSLVVGNRNDSETTTEVMAFLSTLGKKYGTARIVVHHVRKGSTKGDEGSGSDRAYGAHEWYSLSDTSVLLDHEDDDGLIRVHPRKIRDHEARAPWLARLDKDTLTFGFVASVEGARKQQRCGPGEAASRVARKIHEVREWVTAKDLADLLDVEIRTINRTLGSADFRRWTEDGFFETEVASGPNPVRYRSTGALPPEMLG